MSPGNCQQPVGTQQLACHLASLNSPDDLRFGPLYRPILRSFVASEVMKTWLAAGRELDGFSYLFDGEGRELYLMLREGNVLHPIKVDAGRAARADEAKGSLRASRASTAASWAGERSCAWHGTPVWQDGASS